MRKLQRSLLLAWIAAAVLVVPETPATVINVNFTHGGHGRMDRTAFGPMDEPSNQAPIPYPGDRFNDISDVASPPKRLIDSEGNPTRIGMTPLRSRNGTSYHSYDGPLGNLMDAYFYVRGESNRSTPQAVQFTLTGFEPRQVIAGITLISSGDKHSQSAAFTIRDTTLTVDDTRGGAQASGFVEGQNYVTFTDVPADSRGRVRVSFASASGGRYVCFNGMQIKLKHDAAEPEPESTEPDTSDHGDSASPEANEPEASQPEAEEPEKVEAPEVKEPEVPEPE